GGARDHERDFVRGDRPPVALVSGVDSPDSGAGAALVAGAVCDRRISPGCLLAVILVGRADREFARVGLTGALCRRCALVFADATTPSEAGPRAQPRRDRRRIFRASVRRRLPPRGIAVRFGSHTDGLGRARGQKGAVAAAMTNTGIAAALDRLTDNRAALWPVSVLGGIAIHLIVWQFSEPSALFSDFYKANWPAAETLWEDGLSATWPLTEKGGFSNLPVVGWLYVPFMWVDEEWAGWVWCIIGMT